MLPFDVPTFVPNPLGQFFALPGTWSTVLPEELTVTHLVK
jgi:hypothetical protein